MESRLYVEVVVLTALSQSLHYAVPRQFYPEIQVGKRVVVPLGRREVLGVIVSAGEGTPPIPAGIKLRGIHGVIDEVPAMPEELLLLAQRVAHYYFYPLGEVLKDILPASLQAPPARGYRVLPADSETPARVLASSGWIEGAPNAKATGPPQRTEKWVKACLDVTGARALLPREPPRQLLEQLDDAGGTLPLRDLRQHVTQIDYWVKKLERLGLVEVEWRERQSLPPRPQDIPWAPPPDLTARQQEIVDTIRPCFEVPSFQPFLLYGVTGSGKTEVYLRLTREALEHRRSVLVLVPEIALSTQLEALFRQRLGDALGIWHSGLPAGVRENEWRRALLGKSRVILGVRSAVFLPLPRLGLIIVDEEHDLSYKQEDRLRYHARDVALMRAQLVGVPTLLGSATPSLQSLHQSHNGRYRLLTLPERIFEQPLPTIQVVDMRRERSKSRVLSRALQETLRQTLGNREQAILFLNRRGFATFLLCRLCGEVLQCPHCSVSLTYHRERERLCCHYCGGERPLPEECPSCRRAGLFLRGFGTERVEHELRQLLPTARLVRLDRDTVAKAGGLVHCLDRMRHREADVLIGTQMVAKGHDFPHVTLVGVINADTSLQISDFRAGEISVQLLMQVAGRAGRREETGRVIVQTYNPQHPTIQALLHMDYLEFCRQELDSRQRLQYPPTTRLLKLLVTSRHEEDTRLAAQELAHLCREAAGELRAQRLPVAILGPAPAPLRKLKNRYRWHIFVKAWTNQELQKFAATVFARAGSLPVLRRVQLSADRDPVSTL
jgi:primosomal protein N' (replication factor Y)